MIESQWENVLASFVHDGSQLRIVDYGCGQGLAGVFLAGAGANNAVRSARTIVLVEPSPIALTRAEAVYRALAPESEITCLCKAFDDVSKNDLAYDGEVKSLHLFSNVLDVNGYDRFGLLSKALTVGGHTILAVSHDRDHDGGSERIHSLDRALNDPSLQNCVKIGRSNIIKFNCNNTNKSAAIYWHCDLDIRNG
jgi:Predicted O-methyltransferase